MGNRLVYLMIFTAFLGSAFLAVPITEGFSLFPFRVLLIPAGALALGKGWVAAGGPRMPGWESTRFYFAFLLFWLTYSMLSLAWADDTGAAIKGIVFLLINLSVVLIVGLTMTERKELERFYRIWIWAYVPMLVLGMVNVVTGHQFVEYSGGEIPKYYQYIFNHTPRAFYNNQNDYATYVALCIPFVTSWYRFADSSRSRALAALVWGASVVILLLTLSRANILATVVGLLFTVFALSGRMVGKRKAVLYGAAALVSLAVTVLVLTPAGDPLFDLLSGLRSPKPILESGSNSSRLGVLLTSCSIFLRSFGAGVGIGNAPSYLKEYGVTQMQGISNVHNWLMEILLEYGVLVFVGYLVFYFRMFRELLRIRRRLDDIADRRVCDSLLAAMAVFPLASVSSSSVFNFLPQWLLYGFCISFIAVRGRAKA